MTQKSCAVGMRNAILRNHLNNNKDWILRVTCQRIGIKYSNKEYRQHSRPRQRWSSDLRDESVINGLLLECSFEFDLDWTESRQGWSFTDNFFLVTYDGLAKPGALSIPPKILRFSTEGQMVQKFSRKKFQKTWKLWNLRKANNSTENSGKSEMKII